MKNLMLISLAVVVLVAAPSSARSTSVAVFATAVGVKCSSSMYESTKVQASSALECQEVCEETKGPRAAYTFDVASGTCELMERCDVQTLHEDSVRGIRQTNILIETPIYLGGTGVGCESKSIDKFEGSTESECMSRCTFDPACSAYTYNKDSMKCYLKGQCDNYSDKPHNDSGFKAPDALVESSYAWLAKTGCSNDSLRGIKNVPNAAYCQQMCDEYGLNCRAFTYNVGSQYCYLKSSCTDKKSKDDNVSGIKP